MKKIVILILSVFLLNALQLNIKNGWQLKGSSEDLNISVFNNPAISYVWVYDSINNKWKIYLPNNSVQMDNLPSNLEKLDLIKANEGFWVYSNSDIILDTNSSIIDPSLIAYYKFDNNLNDSSGYDNTLYFQTSIFTDANQNINYQEGYKDKSLNLYDSKYYTNSLNNNTTFKNGCTISLWVNTFKLNSVSKVLAIIPKDTTSSNSSDLGIDLYYPSHSGWKFALSISSNDDTHYEVFPSNENAVDTDKWYHIVYTIDSNGKVRDWYNGIEGIGADISNPKFLDWNLSDYKIQIGSRDEGVDFNGTVDEVKIYNRVLSDDEIAKLNNQ